MDNPQIELPPKLIPVFLGEAMYRGAYGGRGSAKSRSFAKMAAVKGIQCSQAGQDGVIVCAREFQNSIQESSFAEVKGAIYSEPWMLDYYVVGDNYIRTKDKLIDFAFTGMRHNLDSIKSKSKIRLLWVDEAEPVSETAWDKADKTVREEGAEVWVTWNPERKASATNQRFRENPPSNSKIVQLNWRDNPWFFKSILNAKRLEDLEKRPDQYQHIWEGDYVTALAGAYFSKHITAAKDEHRIGHVARDPLMSIKAFCDIGGTGAKADAFAIWICQFIGKEVRVLDYYEAIGQTLVDHVAWLRNRDYDKCTVYLPHDGVNHDKVFDVTYESEFRRAGFSPIVIKNQGQGAAMQRVEAIRKIFPSCWFNEKTTQGGVDALGWYHEKKDETRGIGLGPMHDWSSHGTDAFGLMAIVADELINKNTPKRGGARESSGWMG